MLTDFIEAVKHGDRSAIKQMLDLSPELRTARTESGVSAVLLALYYGQVETAGYLAGGGQDLDIFEASALGDLARLGEILLHSPEMVNAYAPDGFQPLGLACFFRQPQAARTLLAHGAQINSPSNNPAKVMPLHSAVASEQLELAEMLLKGGAQVNARQGGGFIPLHGAAQNGQMEMVRVLLEYGADPGLVNDQGKTPAETARENGHTEIAELLSGGRRAG